MKRVICGLLTATILAATCAGLCACKEEDAGEPFVGVASEEVFETAEKAAEAFFQEEICGEDDSIVFVKYEKKGDLTTSEISALALSEEDRAGLVSAESGEVVYYDESEETASLAAKELSREEYRIKMFVLYMKENCKYYVPPVETGERLTKSYYMSLLDIEKYTNCTFEFTIKELESTDTFLYKVDGKNAAAFALKINEQDSQLKFYDLPYKENGVQIGNSKDNISEFYAVAINSTPLELVHNVILQLMFNEFNHLVKTADGFSLDKDDTDTDKYIIAKIKNNRIISYSEGSQTTSFIDITFSDFGTTKVEIPADVQKVYDDFVKEQEAK